MTGFNISVDTETFSTDSYSGNWIIHLWCFVDVCVHRRPGAESFCNKAECMQTTVFCLLSFSEQHLKLLRWSCVVLKVLNREHLFRSQTAEWVGPAGSVLLGRSCWVGPAGSVLRERSDALKHLFYTIIRFFFSFRCSRGSLIHVIWLLSFACECVCRVVLWWKQSGTNEAQKEEPPARRGNPPLPRWPLAA